MKVFSVFTWIGGFELGILQAFWKENVEIVGYSEIDKFSSAVLAHRFPGVKNYGDITLINLDELPDFDVLVGGSPCQDLSISKENREGLMGEKSGLFFEYVRILRTKLPAYFVLENVASMSIRDRDFISETVWVAPIKINSALLTAQNRNRYYWTNIPGVQQPKNLWFELYDILEREVEEKYFIDWQARKGKKIRIIGNEKTPATLTEIRTDAGNQERLKNKALLGLDTNSRTKENMEYVVSKSKKANCLTGAIHAVNMIVIPKEGWFGENSLAVRMPTPIECERLQGFPDNRTLVPRWDRMMSDTQRYKQTWNAVTVNVIQHIFEALKRYLISRKKGNKSWKGNSWFVTPLPFPKSVINRRHLLTVKKFVAYYAIPFSKKWGGLNLDSQKAIIQYFTKRNKAEIIEEFLDEKQPENWKNYPQLKKAIQFCIKNKYTLIVATLDKLSNDIDEIFAIKKKLGNLFISCDLPTSDNLTLSIYNNIKQRQKLLNSIRTKATFQRKKAEWKTFGFPKNLTAKGRKLGLAKIKQKATENTRCQKTVKLIVRCKQSGMGFGSIAKILNKNGFLTIRGKPFYKESVKRLYKRYLANSTVSIKGSL